MKFSIFEKKLVMDLSQQDWTSQLKSDTNAIILDVRTDDEWNDGFITGAIQNDIYKGQGFIYLLEELDKSKNYYVYCKAGARSSQACIIMNQLGFKTSYNLLGGFMNWEGEVEFPNK